DERRQGNALRRQRAPARRRRDPAGRTGFACQETLTRMPNASRNGDVVIIGGGVMGMSAAYHLATRGARVTLLEADQMFGTGSTALNAGGFRHQFSTGVNIELSKRSLEMLGRFEEEFEQAVAYNPCGYLFLLSSEDDVAAFRKNVAVQHEHG